MERAIMMTAASHTPSSSAKSRSSSTKYDSETKIDAAKHSSDSVNQITPMAREQQSVPPQKALEQATASLP